MPTVSLNVNGSAHTLDVRDRAEPLLFVLRNWLSLTGAKYGCGLGQCGACTVLIDGEPARSCSVEVGSVAGKAITTIEGIGAGDLPHPVQAAFIAEQAAQCGYCTAGMVMSARALLGRGVWPSEKQVRDALAGNLCRCGSHARVIRAVLRAAAAKPGARS